LITPMRQSGQLSKKKKKAKRVFRKAKRKAVKMTKTTDKEYPKWVDHPHEIRGKTKDGKPIPQRVLVADKE